MKWRCHHIFYYTVCIAFSFCFDFNSSDSVPVVVASVRHTVLSLSLSLFIRKHSGYPSHSLSFACSKFQLMSCNFAMTQKSIELYLPVWLILFYQLVAKILLMNDDYGIAKLPKIFFLSARPVVMNADLYNMYITSHEIVIFYFCKINQKMKWK